MIFNLKYLIVAEQFINILISDLSCYFKVKMEVNPKILEDLSKKESVIDNVSVDEDMRIMGYKVYTYRWLVLSLFVLFSASNSMQWTQYTIIQDIVVEYYAVPGTIVSWTSMVYMITYVPLIFPASWLLDRVVSFLLICY